MWRTAGVTHVTQILWVVTVSTWVEQDLQQPLPRAIVGFVLPFQVIGHTARFP